MDQGGDGPTTLLTRFAEELRRAPAAGDFEFRIGEEIAHAKVAKGGKGEEKFGRRKAESEKEIRG